MYRSLYFNQITIITDGFSNEGISPIEAAKKAVENNITVNVIGITDNREMGDKGKIEIERIAEAGKGIAQIVSVEHIAKTVQMVTKKTINKTLQQIVQRNLFEILGNSDLTLIPPNERIKVSQMMDKMSEYSNLNILLLIDLSSSMISKINKIKEAIVDFQLSLQARAGRSNIAILSFPGTEELAEIKIPWTDHIINLHLVSNHLQVKGNTPTGPALLASIRYFSELKKEKKKTGVLDEYVV